MKNENLPHLVIVGAGFGGLRAAKKLTRAPVNVTVIDRQNHHLFQPLLYQVATAALSPADIAEPIRKTLRRAKNIEVLLAEVTGIEPGKKRVRLADRAIAFDYLILALGAENSYFGHDAWEPFAPGLKTIPDALTIRRKILTAFEQAEMERDPLQQKMLLNFIVVGGGSTGVEMAGAIAELARKALAKDFRRINPRSAQINLLEAGPRILPAFPEKLSRRASHDLKRLGVRVLVNSAVENVADNAVYVGGQPILARTMIWAAGIKASPAGRWLNAALDRMGRVKVEKNLSLAGHPDIFVIGDSAYVEDQAGAALPQVAPVAMQQGDYVARLIRRRLAGKSECPAFRYKNRGNLSTIGRASAVADLGFLKVGGFVAWVLWLVVHIIQLIGFQNRVLVLIQWAWAYLTFQRGARLITPMADQDRPGAKQTG